MLRLESYLSPFLLSYLSKYIKDIEAKDLQLSLWGGDAVLHNLQFKLDALDNELGKAPFSFVSCHAQELQIHVPWSKLASECVVVTLNTVECVVKLNCNKTLKKTNTNLKDEPPQQPSYVNSLLKKIKNNISLIVNNLIIKYVEDDVVLSVNIHSVLYQCVDELWRPSFVEITEADPVLRRVWELKDVTVCLDKRGSSGLVESFEDPLLFRTNFVFREHNVYPSPASRKPLATKINLMINRYELNISENQLPLFLHMFELCFYMYYGKLDVYFQEANDSGDGLDKSQKQGWASWAWSYVPPVLNYEMEENEVKTSIFSFAIYIKTIVIKLKPSRAEPLKQFHSTHTDDSMRPFLEISAEGFSLILVAKGLEIFSCVSSLCNGCIRFLGGVPSFLNNQVLPHFDNDTNILLASGGGPMFGFSADSLFDFRSPENNSTLFDYALTKEAFFASDSQQSQDNIFFSQYLYIASDGRDQTDSEQVEFSDHLKTAVLTDVYEWKNVQEKSWKHFCIGGKSCYVQINSYTLLCIDVLKSWASSHNIKAYPLASPQKIYPPKVLENLQFIPTRSSTFILKNVHLSVCALHLQSLSYQEKTFSLISALDGSVSKVLTSHNDKSTACLPTVVFSIPTVNIAMVQPMYGSHLAAYTAIYASPLPKLTKACSTIYELKIPLLNVYLTQTASVASEVMVMPTDLQPLLTLKMLALDHASLQGKEFWQKRSTMVQSCIKLEVQQVLAEFDLQQLEFFLHLLDSWLVLISKQNSLNVLDVCQVKELLHHSSDLFCHVDFNSFYGEMLETFACMSLFCSLKSFDAFWHISQFQIIPIVQCTSSSQPMHTPEQFLKPSAKEKSFESRYGMDGLDSSNHCVSFYTQLPYSLNSNGCILLTIKPFFVNVDPHVLSILSQVPSVPLKSLMPSLLSSKVKEDNSKDQLCYVEKIKSRFAVQIQSHGGQVFCLQSSHPCLLNMYKQSPAIDLVSKCILQANAKAVCISVPSLTANTGGFKPVQISTKLLSTGVLVNKFTEFGRFNFGLENASVFIVLAGTNATADMKVVYAMKPCAAACTIVFKEMKESKINAALHVDLESIAVDLSLSKISLLIEVLHSVLHSAACIKKNCSLFVKQSLKPLTVERPADGKREDVTESRTTMDQLEDKDDDLKSTASFLVPPVPARNLPFTLWMQCTLPRFMLSVHCDEESKVVLYVDDVSMSLDCQSVYLKLMLSLSTFDIAQWEKQNQGWVKSNLLGLMFNRMFSVLPSFLQKFHIPKESSPVDKAETSVKPGKFLDFTFTQALASDYRRNVQDEPESVDQTNSSLVIAASEPAVSANAVISEIICVMQPFDILLCPKQMTRLAEVFLPLLQFDSDLISPSEKSLAQQGIVLPVVYITINGARFFLPDDASKHLSDDVLMLCCGKFEINPYPQNPLSRLVISPSLFKRASSAGLLNCPGSLLEDKQFELSFQDLSLGTAKATDLVSYLNKPSSLSENPALQWSMLKQLHVTEPVFHPMIEQFNLKVTFAPSIYHTSQSGKCRMVCGPSLEVGFTTNLVVHLTSMQLKVISELLKSWSDQYKVIAKSIMSMTKAQTLSIEASRNDSGLSIGDAGSHQTSEKRVQRRSSKLIGDNLITGQKMEVFLYKFSNDDHDVCPLLQLKIDQPSFVLHISKTQQKLVLQFHNAHLSVPKFKTNHVKIIHEQDSFPVAVFETLPGKCNKRTGVPFSLCTLTVDHFLTNKANLKLRFGKPMKATFNDSVISSMAEVLKEAQLLQSPTSVSSTESSHFFEKFATVSFHSGQIVTEIESSSHILRCSVAKIDLNTQASRVDVLGNVNLFGISARIQAQNKSFIPLLYPVSLNTTLKYCRADSCGILFLSGKFTSAKCALTSGTLVGSSAVSKTLQNWKSFLSASTQTNSTTHQPVSEMPKIFQLKNDDIRKGKYTYLNTTKETLVPLPGQIVFSSHLPVSSMSWCYDKPHTINRVWITPIPFNEILGDGSDVLCFLESFDECLLSYVCRKKFYVSETKHIDFTLHDDSTPFHEMIFSTKWRVSVHNTDRCHVSPLSLAASMNVEAIYNSSSMPSIAVSVTIPTIKFVVTTADDKFENMELELSNFSTSLEMWNGTNKAIKANVRASLALQTLEFHNLTWIPVLLPMRTQVNMLQSETGLSIASSVPQKAEIHVSPRIIQSLQHLIGLFSSSNPVSPSLFILENRTSQPILFGQALTDECITLGSNAVTTYTWRTNKVEPMLHVSVDGLYHWIWSSAFCPYTQQTVNCLIDSSNSIVAHISRNSSHQYLIVLTGCTRISNHLGVDLQACLTIEGVTTYVNCSSTVSAQQEFLFSLKSVSTILLKLGNHAASESIFANELLDLPGSSKLIHFSTDEGVVNAQVYCLKDGFADEVVIMPLFIVRSFLPSPVILHVKTRASGTTESIKLPGCGNQIYLKSLSPFATHHLTIQLNENESPFDATVPVHFSLTDTLTENDNSDVSYDDLVKFYPFNSVDYDGIEDEQWLAGDGSIQAKLSLQSRALMVEIMPWCLMSNQTNTVFCITSPDDCVSIIQPNQIMTLHHFSGLFNIRSVNSSCSEWLTLTISPELDHPSRADKLKLNHLPYNGYRAVALKSNSSIIELILRSSVHHGIRVVTIVPRWNFVNLATELDHLKILPCVCDQLMNFEQKDCVLDAQKDAPVPVLCWRTEIEQEIQVTSSQMVEERDTVSVESSMEKTNSSFLCVEKGNIESVHDKRILCFDASQTQALVSVKEGFTKKIVEFHSPSSENLQMQMYMTKHNYHGCFYVVLREIKNEKYNLQNRTDMTLCLRECIDGQTDALEIVIQPNCTVKYESSMDAEVFPLCFRRYRALRFQLRKIDHDSWTDVLISAKESCEKILLPNAKVLFVDIVSCNGDIQINFCESPKSLQHSASDRSLNCTLNIKELQVILMDDTSNPLHSIDVVQLLCDDIDLSFSREQANWIAKVSFLRFQVDNQVFPESDFPVFLSSESENQAACFTLTVFLNDNNFLNKIEILAERIELQSEEEFLQSLSRLLQSYLAFSQLPGESATRRMVPDIPGDVEKEINVLSNPLRFQSIVIHPVTLLLSVRASMTLSLSVDRGAITFAKFVRRDIDTTLHEMVQELTRHYFAEAIYGAGWVLGSVDLLGNPASTIRSYVKGISDFIVLPYQGIINGPTAFLGGITRGVASLLRHFSAGTLRSVTNITSGISRNLGSGTKQLSNSSLQIGATFGEKTSHEKESAKPQSSYVYGVTKALVGVVAKPLGGAAGLVSRTGETILRKAGLEEHKAVRYASLSHATSCYQNSLSKYSAKVVQEAHAESPLSLVSLDCQIICLNGVAFSATLVLSPTTLYIFQLVDDIMETSICVEDIALRLEKNLQKDGYLLVVLSSGADSPVQKNSNYSEKVANYLGVKSSPQESSSTKHEHVKYTAELKDSFEADLFLAYFEVVRQTANKFEW